MTRYETKIAGKSKRDLLVELSRHGQGEVEDNRALLHGSIMVACVEDLEDSLKNLSHSIDEANRENQILNKRLSWLNIALVAVTLVGAVATAIIAYKALTA